jgi:sugar/nucleoside kinase (ribokinase family)
VKRRYTQNGQKLFETYSEEGIQDQYIDNIEDYDIVILADFGHNYFNKETRDSIYESDIFKSLNVQYNAGNEGLNTIRKYNNYANYICIDEHELRLAFSDSESDIEDILDENFKDKDIIISITNRDKGSIVYKRGLLVRVPAFAETVIDSVGAGDAYLSITTPLAKLNAPIDVIGFVGNCAGAIACSYYGNKESVDKDKLCEFIGELLK